MKDVLVVGKLKDGMFEKFMGFMQSEQGMAERKKVADVTKTMASVTPDKKAVMFKFVAHDMAALHAFLDGTNPVSKPIFDEVMEGYEIFELSKPMSLSVSILSMVNFSKLISFNLYVFIPEPLASNFSRWLFL